MDYAKGLNNYLECEVLLRKLFDEVGLCGTYNICPSWCRCANANVPRDFPSIETNPLLDEERINIYGNETESNTCPYNTIKGCKLQTHKPIICITYACPGLIKYFKEWGIDYDKDEIESGLTDVLMNIKSNDELKTRIQEMIKKTEQILIPENISPELNRRPRRR